MLYASEFRHEASRILAGFQLPAFTLSVSIAARDEESESYFLNVQMQPHPIAISGGCGYRVLDGLQTHLDALYQKKEETLAF
ncbi:hypothetical protein [Hymenobacter sp. BT491]|uniref:hypothetical protein n=1 Tax=Hymenobacter sp. BT491 TaxID=2766779 RepID=UPI001653BEBC|nr:hypothetical protein [Hymenobacter sp. BT491]MBC6988983.1 hypothetical protein [Hymenobacter sp. BT491]